MKNNYIGVVLFIISIVAVRPLPGQPFNLQVINGEFLVAYRVAALAFFKVESIEKCEKKIIDYDVCFSLERDNINVTFITPVVDYTRMKESKNYAQDVIRKGGTGTTVILTRKDYKIISMYKNR